MKIEDILKIITILKDEEKQEKPVSVEDFGFGKGYGYGCIILTDLI